MSFYRSDRYRKILSYLFLQLADIRTINKVLNSIQILSLKIILRPNIYNLRTSRAIVCLEIYPYVMANGRWKRHSPGSKIEKCMVFLLRTIARIRGFWIIQSWVNVSNEIKQFAAYILDYNVEILLFINWNTYSS